MIKKGNGEPPKNQRKPWDDQEKLKLFNRFNQLYDQLKNKRKVIEILQKEFGRGYFSIYNQINNPPHNSC